MYRSANKGKNVIAQHPEITHFDVVGDLHGCYYELLELVDELGYTFDEEGLLTHPEGRTFVLIGDVTDRGFYNSLCLQFAYNNWKAGRVLWVQGNHDNKLFRWMKGNPVRIAHGLERSSQELDQAWPFHISKNEMGEELLESVPTLIELDGGAVHAVHASPGKSKIHMYGIRGGPDNERICWWETYDGDEFIVFGHYWISDDEPLVGANYCCVDTSCVLGGTLSALRWPERETVSVQAKQAYYIK